MTRAKPKPRHDRRFSIYTKVKVPSPKGELVKASELRKQISRLAGRIGGIRSHHGRVPRELIKALRTASGDLQLVQKPKIEIRRVELVNRKSGDAFAEDIRDIIDALKKHPPKSGFQKIKNAEDLDIDRDLDADAYEEYDAEYQAEE